MISVAEALDAVLQLVTPLEAETVPLADAARRVMAQSAVATRDQPPFAASAMDGYAVKNDEVADGAHFNVIGEAKAGKRFFGVMEVGEAVRIFTGAPMPEGADRVIIQEDVTVEKGVITLRGGRDNSAHVRPAGGDFKKGTELSAPRRIGPSDIALLAAMSIADVQVSRRPVVALMATGDELVMPGESPTPDQIIASNSFALKTILEDAGAVVRILPIARDTEASLTTAFSLASDADLIVTLGGASEGDHDLVAPVTEALGMKRAFYKVAMRPGKPLMAGKLGGSVVVGLPGNPVSALVCTHVFIVPMISRMLGLGAAATPRKTAPLAIDIAQNGPREHYMRATLTEAGLRPFDRQDSSLLMVYAAANALLVRPAKDPPRKAGQLAEYLEI